MLTDKRRDMARSVLPSTHRHRSAAALERIRRHHRRAVRQQLGRLHGPLDPDLIAQFDLGDDERFPNHLIHDRVLERRSYDKVAPLIRWAVAFTRTIRVEDRLSHVAAMLPANLIGRHAVSHLRYLHHFLVHFDTAGYFRYGESHTLDDLEGLASALLGVIAAGRHGELNAELKASGVCRPLFGAHDVEAYVEEVLGSQRRWITEWRWDGPGRLPALVDVLQSVSATDVRR